MPTKPRCPQPLQLDSCVDVERKGQELQSAEGMIAQESRRFGISPH